MIQAGVLCVCMTHAHMCTHSTGALSLTARLAVSKSTCLRTKHWGPIHDSSLGKLPRQVECYINTSTSVEALHTTWLSFTSCQGCAQ